MKTMTKSILYLFSLSAFIFSCDSTEDSLILQPIVGEWSEIGEHTFTLFLDDEEVSKQQFGVIVFGYNEEVAEAEVDEYLKHNVLGPLRLDVPLEFKTNNTFQVNVEGEEAIEGTWQLYNESSRLKLEAQDLALPAYEFDVVVLSCTNLFIRHAATIEILGTDESYDYKVEIELGKAGCN